MLASRNRRQPLPVDDPGVGRGSAAAAAGGSEIPSTTQSAWSWWCRCFWTVLSFFNTFAVAILAGVVTFLFLQLQVLSFQLRQDEEVIAQLQDQVSNQQADQIQQLSQKVDQNHSLTLYQMAGTFTLLTCLLTMFHMSMHLRQYHEPEIQRKIVAILWMSPIYALTSFCSLIFYQADGYLAVIRDFYEAYVVYTFLSFLIAVLGRGNRDLAVDVLAQHAHHLDKPTACLRRFYDPPPETSARAMANAVLMECQILAMQFVFLRPITSILSFVTTTISDTHELEDNSVSATDPATSSQTNTNSSWMETDPTMQNTGNITTGDFNYSSVDFSSWAYFTSPNFYIAVVTNISVFLAFRGLLRFYHAVRQDLAWCQPFSKFMAIKGIVFLTFWQGLTIAIVVHLQDSDEHSDAEERRRATEIQNVLICLEMLFFSIAHWCVFPAEEWEPGYRPRTYAKPGIGIKDFASDMSYIMQSSRERKGSKKYRGIVDGDPLTATTLTSSHSSMMSASYSISSSPMHQTNLASVAEADPNRLKHNVHLDNNDEPDDEEGVEHALEEGTAIAEPDGLMRVYARHISADVGNGVLVVDRTVALVDEEHDDEKLQPCVIATIDDDDENDGGFLTPLSEPSASRSAHKNNVGPNGQRYDPEEVPGRSDLIRESHDYLLQPVVSSNQRLGDRFDVDGNEDGAQQEERAPGNDFHVDSMMLGGERDVLQPTQSGFVRSHGELR